MEEEKKINPQPVEEEIDDDFADASAKKVPEEEPVEEPVEEAVEEAPAPEQPVQPAKKEPVVYEYDAPELQTIEDARKAWNKSYKKMSLIKMLISILVLFAILAGWLIPTMVMKNPDPPTLPLLIGIGCAVVGIAGLVIFGIFQKKHDNAAIRVYFQQYYDAVNGYVFKDIPVEGLTGLAGDKVSEEEFKASGVYSDCAAVGSRDNITFTYDGIDCAMADAAGQKDTGKALSTLFVGKFLRANNKVTVSEPIVIYFEGNERSLPPSSLSEMHLVETTKTFKVYGSEKDKNVLTAEVKKCLRAIKTDDLLVDVTLVITSGRTYLYLGYEDTIMVLPNDKSFNPEYLKRYAKQFPVIMNLVKALN